MAIYTGDGEVSIHCACGQTVPFRAKGESALALQTLVLAARMEGWSLDAGEPDRCPVCIGEGEG